MLKKTPVRQHTFSFRETAFIMSKREIKAYDSLKMKGMQGRRILKCQLKYVSLS